MRVKVAILLAIGGTSALIWASVRQFRDMQRLWAMFIGSAAVVLAAVLLVSAGLAKLREDYGIEDP